MGEFFHFGTVQCLISFGLIDISPQAEIPYYKGRYSVPSNAPPLLLCKMEVDEPTVSTKAKESADKKILNRRRHILKKSSSLASSSVRSENSSSSDDCTDASRTGRKMSPRWDKKNHSLNSPLPGLKIQSRVQDTAPNPQTELSRSLSFPGFLSRAFFPWDQSELNMALSTGQTDKTATSTISTPECSKCKPGSATIDSKSVNTLKQDVTVGPRRKMGHVRSRSDIPRGVHFASSVVAAPFSAGPGSKENETYFKRPSLLEEGCQSVVPKTECFFPRPQEGQSLTSFLSSEDFQTCAELDRENAHFYISEALISAIEQIKCNQLLQKAEEYEEESDEEIQLLKQRIRIRRKERQQEKENQKGLVLLSDGVTDTTTSQSASSPMSSTYTSDFSSCSSDDVDELEFSDTNTSSLSQIQEKGLSLSLASLYSDADIKRVGPVTSPTSSTRENVNLASWELSRETLTAEAVALSLLKKFSEKQLPKASDLEWLVSEQDAPQRLLPLPDSWPVSPDDVEEQISMQRTRLRGTMDWAPPRAQIIFIIHPDPNRKALLAKQQYRCSGCGIRIERGFIHRFRYCKYLGKYFCQCCHNNSAAIIPSYVLQRWDFRKYYVSNFSRDLLERMDADPLFNIVDINPSLYKKSRSLDNLRNCRLQLSHLVDYINTCKDAVRLKKDLDCLPCHWVREPHVYSIQDFVQLKKGTLGEALHRLCVSCLNHVAQCTLCQGKGFICEVCRDVSSVIFPFQLNKVIQCQGCGSCFHRGCFDPKKCPKCARLELRKKKLSEDQSLSSEEET